ncbi:alpha/beta hydrolase [Corallococcus llansteffanensis]|uniref:Alpha/beta fold hydrolase n=1 Tax=Corallococcus llansteffanensis TaxID=2316731 RepID=A0A3A8QAN4_9BACT|nr:alpha/beta fold hydrolase [Corallococcus llansteffanensis]RKH60344.1 alpha/beta fold hydrolase [Corallococcus llansteffanensis]
MKPSLHLVLAWLFSSPVALAAPPAPAVAGSVALAAPPAPEVTGSVALAEPPTSPVVAGSVALAEPPTLAVTGAVARTLPAADGATIPVRILEPHGKARAARPPVALLIHGLTRSKEDWLADAPPTYGGAFTEALRAAGYRVYLLDARHHGERKLPGEKPSLLVKRLHAGEPGPYVAMLSGTATDAQVVLAHALEGGRPSRVLVAGYSMGAQVALMLAAREPRITHLVTMVPPDIEPALGDVAPINVVDRVRQRWLLLSANQDEFAPAEKSAALFSAAPSPHKVHRTFESGHALPRDYLQEVQRWLAAER